MVAPSAKLRTSQRSPNPFFDRKLFFLFLIATAVIFFSIPKWEEVVRQNEDGEYVLQDWREGERVTEMERNDNAEQYRLIAKISDFYSCYLCKHNFVWINRGETLKIGITTNPSTRYSQAWLDKNNVYYFVDTVGDLATVRKSEIDKIAGYPLWPENVKRPTSERLVVPPFHGTVRLK